MKFSRNSNIFIRKNALENVVCEMSSNSSRPQSVKLYWVCVYLFLVLKLIYVDKRVPEGSVLMLSINTVHLKSLITLPLPLFLILAVNEFSLNSQKIQYMYVFEKVQHLH